MSYLSRRRGPQPKLCDSEVLTMEMVGEFLEIDTDKAIWNYFNDYWRDFFPNMSDRSNFSKQAANLHVVKRLLQEKLSGELGGKADTLHIIDGFPIPICKFARAGFSRLFKGDAAYGYCASKKEHYYGFEGHIVINSLGVISGATFAKANIDEREICPEVVEDLHGLLIGDKGYIRPGLESELKQQDLHLQTPLRENMLDERPKSFLKWLMSTRRLVETVIGQLTERFHISKVWARDVWHEASRFWRKILAHTIFVKINYELGNKTLQFDELMS